MNDMIGYDGVKELHSMLGWEEAQAVKLKAAAVAEFMLAKDKDASAKAIRARLAPRGIRGISKQSLYRMAKLCQDAQAHGRPAILALVDGRTVRKASCSGLSSNKQFIDYWHQLVMSNRRNLSAAYRELFSQLTGGAYIPGFGDWRDVYAAEHNGIYPADREACPYAPYNAVPRGWSIRMLTRLAPGKFQTVAARSGMMAAQMGYAPDIIRTRAGLRSCQCVQIDDMWYEHKVAFGNNRHAQRVVEFGMIDVCTGYMISHLTKPIIEDNEGKRKTLKSEWTRYLIGHLLCNVGIPADGCLIMGEHGTATADSDLLKALDEITGGTVRFGAGGLLSKPLAKGLHGGIGGNPRFKGLLEGFHSVIKGELAAAPGHMGGGRDKQPEDVYGLEKEDEMWRRIAMAAETMRPGISGRIRLPFMLYGDFCELIEQSYDKLNGRTWHQLEGWQECGFVTGEWRATDGDQWRPMSALEAMPVKAAQAFRSLITADPSLFRMRSLSPREAWIQRKDDRHRYDQSAMPLILGKELARECTVGNKVQIRYVDRETMRDLTISGILSDGRQLDRGMRLMVWCNPLSPVAHIADKDGRYLGTAEIIKSAMYGDQEAIEHQLGARSAVIAEERDRLAPIARKRQAEISERYRMNAIELIGRDPAEDDQIESATRQANHSKKVSVEDLILSEKPFDNTLAVSVDDLI